MDAPNDRNSVIDAANDRDLGKPPGTGLAPIAWLGGLEWPIPLALLLSAGAVWLFAELAGAVMDGGTAAFDRTLLLAFRNAQDVSDPVGPSWFEEMMRDVTALGGNAVLSLVTLIAVGLLFAEGKRHAAVLLLICVVGGMLLSTLVKMGFDRPRPDLVPHGARTYTASFPSGHSMMSATVFLTLGTITARMRRRWRAKAFILFSAVLLTLLVGISRVYLGVHWPTDVLAGWAAGSAWALMCWAAALWLQRRGKVEAPSAP